MPRQDRSARVKSRRGYHGPTARDTFDTLRTIDPPIVWIDHELRTLEAWRVGAEIRFLLETAKKHFFPSKFPIPCPLIRKSCSIGLTQGTNTEGTILAIFKTRCSQIDQSVIADQDERHYQSSVMQ